LIVTAYFFNDKKVRFAGASHTKRAQIQLL